MKIKLFLVPMFFLMLFIGINAQNSANDNSKNDEILDNLISKALEVSPKLKVLKNKKLASETLESQVSNLPDPVLTLGLANLPTNSFSFTQEPMTGKIVGLSQKIPFPGKLNAAGEAKKIEPELVQKEIDDSRNEIKMEVAQNYFDLANIRKTIEYTRESKKLLQSIADVVKTKYEVSKASQQNLIQIQSEITRIEDKIKKLESKERTFQSNLNALILADPSNSIRTAELEDISQRDFSVNLLDSLAQVNRPFLSGIKLRVSQSKLMKNVADYNNYPNFNLSIQYSQRDRIARTNTDLTDFFSVMVGITLPLNYGGKNSSSVQEAELKEKMFEDQYDAARQILYQKFGSSISTLRELKEREELLKDGLLPQSQQAFNSALSAYQVDEIDFINVIDAQNKLLNVETELYSIRADYYKELNKLEFLVGTRL